MIAAPVTYQGAKHRYAAAIIDRIKPRFDEPFYDLCCGSGTVSIELVNRGFNPKLLYMIDSGPWGIFWHSIGKGLFNLNRLQKLLERIPDRPLIQNYARQLAKQPAHIDTPYVYLILQACAFGGKAIWIEDDRWKNTSFRSFWQPNGIARRKSTVNPMMPMPDTLYERVKVICERMHGVHACHCDVQDFGPNKGTVYIDPPYVGTTGYGDTFDVVAYASHRDCWVSEAKPLSTDAVLLADSKSRTRGGISGNRSSVNEEWLSHFSLGA